MKKHVVSALVALMFMAPVVHAEGPQPAAPPTGPNAKGLEATQPSKDVARAHDKKNKKKKVKPLTPKEREEMERRLEVTQPPGDAGDDGMVK